MSFKVEAAVITQKGTSARFNSDSININKKVLPREVSANGYKGAGIVSGKAFFALAGAQVESCADAAVVSLNERSGEFLADSADVQNIFADFFKDITGALTEMGHNSSAFSCALFYADENEAIISQTGSVRCFRYSEEKLYFVDPILSDHTDALSQYGSCRFDDVKDGDLFFLLDENVADTLNNELLENICKQCAGNTKVAVKLLLSKVSSELNAGAFALKVLKSEEEVVGAETPVAADDENSASAPVALTDEAVVNEDREVKKEKKSVGSKAAVLAISAMLIVVLFVAGVFVGRYLKTVIAPAEDSQPAVEETQETTVETTEAAEETTEETTEEESTADETTTEVESTTRKSTQASSGSVVTTTRAPETTTKKPVAETTTKAASETTTKPEKETTTAKAEESTAQEETVTDAQEKPAETTTVAEEGTTHVDSAETTEVEQESIVG